MVSKCSGEVQKEALINSTGEVGTIHLLRSIRKRQINVVVREMGGQEVKEYAA